MKLIKNCIYQYYDNGNRPFGIYLCDISIGKKILIVPLTNIEDEHTYKLSVTRQFVALDRYVEIDSDSIIKPLYLKSNLVLVPPEDIGYIHRYIVKDFMKKIEMDINKNPDPISVFEQVYDFLRWGQKKLSLNILPYKSKTTVCENGIYWVLMGVNVGSELNKYRPALIWKSREGNCEANNSYIVIPITSSTKPLKYYMNVPIDIDGKVKCLKTEDMRRVSIRRIVRPLRDQNGDRIFIDKEKRQEIRDALQKFYIYKNAYEKN